MYNFRVNVIGYVAIPAWETIASASHVMHIGPLFVNLEHFLRLGDLLENQHFDWKGKMIGSMDDIELTVYYWDCECEKDYIHLRLQESCPVCKAESEDQPDSRVPEVIKYGFVVFGQETAETQVKRLTLAWMKDNLSLDDWPENERTSLSDEFDLNIYIDDDGNKRATAFSTIESKIDLESSIEVL